MPKRPRTWNRSCYEKRLRGGRGEGEGAAYLPWITVQDFSSRGTISRVKGWKTDRVHQFMSNLEFQYFLILEWANDVIDIREQYPLLDVTTTIEIAQQAGIRHPYDPVSGFPHVLTSDFLITTGSGIVARTVKMSAELSNLRVLEKLELERRYWQSKGGSWKIVTEREINRRKARNIEWLHTCRTLRGISCDNNLLDEIISEMEGQYQETTASIRDICAHTDQSYPVDAGTGLILFKHLLASKRLCIEMDKSIDLSTQRDSDMASVLERKAV